MDTLFILGFVVICLEGAFGALFVWKFLPGILRSLKAPPIDHGPAANDPVYNQPDATPDRKIIQIACWD